MLTAITKWVIAIGTDGAFLLHETRQTASFRSLGHGWVQHQTSGEYPVVELTPAGRQAVTSGTPPQLMLPAAVTSRTSRAGAQGDAPVETIDRLRRRRTETARAASAPAYVVFHDSTLTAIAVARPSSRAELLRVVGVGDSKLRKYAEEVLEILGAE